MTISIIGQAGTFATIQAAVTAAANGATISVTAGTYTENVTITDKWVTIDGDKSGGAVNLNGQITVAGTLNGVLAITDLNINATGKPYGVFVSAASTNFAGSVTLDGVAISHAQQDGFAYIRALNGSTSNSPRHDRRGVDPQQHVQRQRDCDRCERPRRHPVVRIQPGPDDHQRRHQLARRLRAEGDPDARHPE